MRFKAPTESDGKTAETGFPATKIRISKTKKLLDMNRYVATGLPFP